MDIEKFEKNLSPTQRKVFEEDKEKIGKQLFQKLQQRVEEDKKIIAQISLLGRKKFIKDSMTSYRAYHNAEYLEHCKYIRKLRSIQANKYASTPDGQFRLLFKLPANLYGYFDKYLGHPFPQNEKETQWFAKTFKEFVVAEKI